MIIYLREGSNLNVWWGSGGAHKDQRDGDCDCARGARTRDVTRLVCFWFVCSSRDVSRCLAESGDGGFLLPHLESRPAIIESDSFGGLSGEQTCLPILLYAVFDFLLAVVAHDIPRPAARLGRLGQPHHLETARTASLALPAPPARNLPPPLAQQVCPPFPRSPRSPGPPRRPPRPERKSVLSMARQTRQPSESARPLVKSSLSTSTRMARPRLARRRWAPSRTSSTA